MSGPTWRTTRHPNSSASCRRSAGHRRAKSTTHAIGPRWPSGPPPPEPPHQPIPGGRRWTDQPELSLVGTVLAYEVVDGVVGVDRPAGVTPEPLEHVVVHGAPLDVPVVHVGDLELTAARGHERADHVEHPGVVAVDAGDGMAGGRVLGLLHDPHDATLVIEGRDAQMAQMHRVTLLGEQDPGAASLLGEALDH